jgi:8-oxo-dGTP pyrophosphatase MutT (NUDIX family)
MAGIAGRIAWRFFILAKAVLHPVAFGAAGAVFDARGRVLLVRHRYMRGWQLPGGGVERGEAPDKAVLRELAEEVGLTGGKADFFGLYTARAGYASNLVALYCVRGGTVAFKPSLEISAVLFADPLDPPPGCTPATLRRLAELSGTAAPTPFW